MLKDLIYTKILSFVPVMNVIGFGALYAQFKTSFLDDPKSWILVGSIVLLNLSKAYKNFKGDDTSNGKKG